MTVPTWSPRSTATCAAADRGCFDEVILVWTLSGGTLAKPEDKILCLLCRVRSSRGVNQCHVSLSHPGCLIAQRTLLHCASIGFRASDGQT